MIWRTIEIAGSSTLERATVAVILNLLASGEPLRWILEIHFIDPVAQIGAFHEGMLPDHLGERAFSGRALRFHDWVAWRDAR